MLFMVLLIGPLVRVLIVRDSHLLEEELELEESELEESESLLEESESELEEFELDEITAGRVRDFRTFLILTAIFHLLILHLQSLLLFHSILLQLLQSLPQ